jgi:hypothetical protein
MNNRVHRTLRRSIAATSAVLAIALSAAAARAQSAEAESLFNDGNTLMKQGKLAEACEAFEASNRIEARAGTLIRLGECREQNGQLASAWSAYKDALTRVKDPKKKAIAIAKARELEGKLSYLTVAVDTDSRAGDLVLSRNGQVLDPALWNRAVPVNGGEYVIVGKASGRQDWTTTVRVPGEFGKVSVVVHKLEELPRPAPVRADKLSPAPARVESAEPAVGIASTENRDMPSLWTTRRKTAVGIAGLALATAATGVVFGSQSRSRQDEAFRLCPDPQQPCGNAMAAESLIKQGQDKALVANIAFGVAGVAAIVTGVLWFTGAPPHSGRANVVLAPSLAVGEAGLVVVGGF